MAFPRDQRLRDKRLIELTKKRGKKIRTPFFLAFILPSDAKKTLVSTAISLKTEPKAVRRNRIKRRISEAVRAVLKENTDLPKLLIMIFGNKQTLDADFEDLKEEVKKVFRHSESAKGG